MHHKNWSTCLGFPQPQLKAKIICHEIPGKPWEVISTDIFTNNNSNLLYGLLQQVSNSEESWKIISRHFSHVLQNYFAQYVFIQINRSRYQFCFRKIQRNLQKTMHWACHIITVHPPEQQQSSCIHSIFSKWQCKNAFLPDRIYTYRLRTSKLSNHTVQQTDKWPATKDQERTNAMYYYEDHYKVLKIRQSR